VRIPEVAGSCPLTYRTHPLSNCASADQNGELFSSASRASSCAPLLLPADYRTDRALSQAAQSPQHMSSDPPRKNETANRAGEHAISRQGRLLHCGDLAAEHRRQGSVSSPEAVKAYDRAIAMMDEAERLGEQPEDPLAYFAAGFGFWLTSHVTADHAMALRRAEQFMARAERQRDSTPFLIAYRIKGISLTMSGQLEAGREVRLFLLGLDRFLAH
jgi:hypothetical protein